MKTTKIFAMLLSLACSMGLYSCSEDTDLTPVSKPALISTGISYESLSFSWDPIPNAVQYGYKLSDESKSFSESGVTKLTNASFSGLQPATTYTLEVWAFAAVDGDYSTPPASAITATTDGLIKLATPEATVSATKSTFKASWTAVENAESYKYVITNSKNEKVKSGNTKKTSVTIKGLDGGSYTFSIHATTTEGGYEDSETFSIPFSVEGSAPLDINSIPGSYWAWTSGQQADDNWNFVAFDYPDLVTTIVKTGDNTVTLDGFYWEDCPVTGTVNISDRTITFPHQIYEEYGTSRCILGSSTKAYGDMIATINDDGSISIQDFGIWFEYTSGDIYKYAYGQSDLVKNTPSSVSKRQAPGISKATAQPKPKGQREPKLPNP